MSTTQTANPKRLQASDSKLTVPDRLDLICACDAITLEAVASDGETESIPRFTMVAYTGEPMRIEGWRFPVVVDLEGMSIPSQRRPVRWR